MKAIIDPHLLRKVLQVVSPVISKTTVLPILECVKMQFNKNELTVTASDLETTMMCSMPCESKDNFTVVVDFNRLADVSKKVFSPILMTVVDKTISLVADDAKFKMPVGGDNETFPAIPEDDYDFSFEAGPDFFEALYNAEKCKSTNDLSVRMNAVCLGFSKAGVKVAGTDAFALYEKKIKVSGTKPHESLVQSKFIHSVKGFDTATVSVGEKFVMVKKADTCIITRVVDHKFVDYGVVLPSADHEFNVTANRADFIGAITKAAISASKATQMCVLNFDGGNGGMRITSQDIDFETEGEAEMKVVHSVETPAIGVSASYLLKILNILDSEDVLLSVTSATKSIYLKNSDSEDVICLVQPLLLN